MNCRKERSYLIARQGIDGQDLRGRPSATRRRAGESEVSGSTILPPTRRRDAGGTRIDWFGADSILHEYRDAAIRCPRDRVIAND